MCVGFTSSAPTAAFGLPFRNGSMSTRVSPSLSSKQACPRNRMSMSAPLVQRFSQLPPNRDAHHHPYARLLGEQRPHRGDALVRIRRGRRLQDLPVVRLATPAALVQRADEYALELRRDPRELGLGLAEALRVAQRLDRRVD